MNTITVANIDDLFSNKGSGGVKASPMGAYKRGKNDKKHVSETTALGQQRKI